jgi:hypothetical protein
VQVRVAFFSPTLTGVGIISCLLTLLLLDQEPQVCFMMFGMHRDEKSAVEIVTDDRKLSRPGMYAANTVLKAGKTVLVVEAADYVGGRTRQVCL